MESVQKIAHPRIVGPVDLQLILNSSVNYKVKLQLIQKIYEYIDECCRTQGYFDNMIFVLLKLISITEPSFIADHDVFKMRKLVLQIIHRVCISNDKIKSHAQNTMRACLKVIETDNEQCVLYSIMIFRELLSVSQPNFDGCFKTEISQFLKLIVEMYNNSNTQEKILSFQKTNDIKILISKIRVTTTITRNAVNYNFTPMGKVSFKVIKELGLVLKACYLLFHSQQPFKNELEKCLPIVMIFFNLDIPYKLEYRDILFDLKHAQVRLLPFFTLIVKDNKDLYSLHISTLAGRVIALFNCSIISDQSMLHTELITAFENLILSDYKYEFLPHMDKFLDESLITSRNWSLKFVLRPKAYIYIDHFISHLHSQLSLNFLVRVIHLYLSNILDTTLQPEIQINLCNMVMTVLNHIVHRQNQLITNISTLEQNKNPLIELFYRIFQIFVTKLKQFQKFYLPQLDVCSLSEEENIQESISSILAGNQSNEKQEFIYGYHSSQIAPYTISDCRRFIRIIIPAIKTLFQFIVETEGDKFSIERRYIKLFKDFLKHSLLSLKIFSVPIKKKEMVIEILSALSCINSINLQTLIPGDLLVNQIYSNSLETFIFDMTLNDEVLATTFSCLIFEFILKHLADEKERYRVLDLIERLQSNFKFNINEEKSYEYVYKVIKMLTNILQNTKHPIFYIGVLKVTLLIIESAGYEFGDNMNSLLNCLFCDLLSYYRSLPSNLVVTKFYLAELCLSDCMFKVALRPQIMDLLPVIAYSLEISELTPQGLSTLEKCLDILPSNCFDNPVLQVQNDIIKGLYHCLNSQFESISEPAVNLLGKFGGLNRSAIINAYGLNAQEICVQRTNKPKIKMSFEGYDKLFEMDFAPGVNTAVNTLFSNDDKFIRNQSWNVLKGFFTVSMDYDVEEFMNTLSHINWETFVSMFVKCELQYTKTIIDETYIKALTGLMICCSDENLKEDALKYFNELMKQIIYISIYHFSGFPYDYELEVNPFVLIDAIIIALSNEKETISNFGIIAAEFLVKELHIILGDNMVYFPYITYMFRQCCELCYDTSWIIKRAGCTGLQILFSNLLTEEMTIKYFIWFTQNFLTAYRALMFTFSDSCGHLTFGALEIAQSNLDSLLNWFYWTQQINTSHNLIQETILKELIDYIVGPNDLVREQSIEMISLMAKKQEKTVLNILEPLNEYIKLAIPGYQLFHEYTFKSQIGIMKGHIFCALHSIPLEQFDHDNSNKTHRYYYYILSVICGGDDEEINKIKMLKRLTSNQLYEFNLTALQALGNSFNCLMDHERIKIYGILLNSLRSPDFKIQEISYHCLKPHCDNTALIDMVDKLLISCIASIEDHSKITIISVRHILYLSKLFPSHPNTLFCSKLVSAFKFVWNDLNHCSNDMLKNELELILENILEILSVIKETQYFNVKELCEIILINDISKIDLCNRLYPWLYDCVLKYPTEFIALFFQKQNIQKSVWSSFFNSMIRSEKCETLRKVMTLDGSHLEALLLSSRIDPSRSIQYECIKIIYNLTRMDKQWITTKKIISILLNIWSNVQYKERFKNLTAIKSTEWDEPKMLLKIVLAYYRENIDDVFVLFQILTVFSYRFPVDLNFFRRVLENEIVNCSIKWKRMVFFKFVDLYYKKTPNGDILGKILQYIILPCFAMSYKNGEKAQLLCSFTKSEENIISIILNKIFNNFRVVLNGCDFYGTKVFLCQLICMSLEDLLKFNENVSTIIYNAVNICMVPRSTMDLNVRCHCYLILICMMLSGNVPNDKKLKEAIYNELLKASYAEAQSVIDYSLNLLIMNGYENNEEINTLVECVKKLTKADSQSMSILHRVCSFVIRYNTLFYPFKQGLSHNLVLSLYPMAKSNNIPEFKKTAIELACMIIKWELTDENMTMKFPSKRKIDEVDLIEESHNSLTPKKKSSKNIDDCLNFLAMVGCQTHDDKQESSISKLATRSAKVFKNILATEAIDTKEVNLRFTWANKILDIFLKKENIVKQNPNIQGNTNASLTNLLTTYDLLSFMVNVLSKNKMLEAIKPLQDFLIQLLQLAYNNETTFNYSQNQKDILLNNQLSVSQYNEGTLNIIVEILKTFSSNEGLEKLHLYIQMIISEGLNSNNPQQLEISLLLLKSSLIHFAHYMNNEVLNTVGDIMFKFNENNENPLIKVKCLEVLKLHIDTLPRSKKQVFIERLVMENLDKARYIENNISFEVKKKCFELIITYIKDLSQATEGVLLNSILLEYIKTTTDERIMEIILDLIAKWIEICRNESVLFNNQTINILKSTIVINRFPKLTEYCYKLNLEIFKNWYSVECIEYGINCKYPSIRYDFMLLYDSLWSTSGLCSRLYSIINNDLSYDIEFSIAFYIQFLFIQISKNTKIQGNFQLLKMNESCDLEICPLQSILTIEVCSSLAQLCFVDVNLAKNVLISIIPSIWSIFSSLQRTLLSSRAVKFLTDSKLKNNFLTSLYEAIILCEPKINFEPHQMVYIGKTYNLWYTVIEQLEDICNCFEHDKKDKAIEGMIQMYSYLREEDVLECLFQNTIKCEDTKKALHFEQLGFFEPASRMYISLLNSETDVKVFNNNDSEFRKIHLTKCLRELNEWNYLSENILDENTFLLNLENTWKESIKNSTCHNLKLYLEQKQQIWPTKINWKYHFYLGMLGLNTLDEHSMFTVQEHIESSVKDIINKWKVLPKYVCYAHIPLLQAIQLINEVQEACSIQKSWLQTPQNISSIYALTEIWNKRKPWIGDDLNVCNDLISWRQTYYSFLNQNNLISKMNTIKSLQDQSTLLFGEVALKQNMAGVCIKTLKSIDSSSASSLNWLYKMFLEAKCVQKAKSYNKAFSGIENSTLNKVFTDDMTSLLLTVRGSFHGYYGKKSLAFKNFSMAFLNINPQLSGIVSWKRIVKDNFIYYHTIDREIPSNNLLMNLNSQEILENAWIQWGTLIQNDFNQSGYKDMSLGVAALECYIIATKLTNSIKCNILMARILWLLTYDNEKCSLLNTFKISNVKFSDFWILQMLNIMTEKKKSTIIQIFSKIGRMHPQKMFFTLNRMYLTEKMNTANEMKSFINTKKNNDCTLIQTGIIKINKIKLMMNLVTKYNPHILQLNYFVDQIISLGESWVEELRRNLYECLYMSYDFAFEEKSLDIPVTSKISNFIETKLIMFVTQDVTTDELRLKKKFLFLDNLLTQYQYFKENFLLDFSFDSVPKVKLIVNKLKNWISYVENKFEYTPKFVHKYRCSTIHNIDWSIIRLPSNHYIDDASRAVKILNFSGHVYLKDKCGTIIKQLTIRGTDGLLYTYNISGGKEIESEERIFQLFHMTNNYLIDFKETAKRFLKFSIPKTFTISPNLRMVETNCSYLSLFEMYREKNDTKWIHEDIDFWFSVLDSSVTLYKIRPLMETFSMAGRRYGSDNVMKNWVSLRYPLLSDYWTFRKTFIEHYALICFFEYAYNLIKLKPEMLNIDKNNGAAVVLYYKFFLDEADGNLVQNCTIPFRMTPNITNFITPYRKYQMINCLTASGLCLNNSFDEISVVLKLLLKEELTNNYINKNDKNLPFPKDSILESVDESIISIKKNVGILNLNPIDNSIPNLLRQALHINVICQESPTWRPWL